MYHCDGQPITHTYISVPGHKLPGMEKLDIDNSSIFQTIRERYGLTVRHAGRWLTAALPDANSIIRMGVSADTPLITIESIAYGHDGSALDYCRAFHNCADAASICNGLVVIDRSVQDIGISGSNQIQK
ncbi:UTRA domain-containing protein [Rhizobium subbaraonis]|uniref:UTRA domain-containing protein n=1 Tax=Rhizobium subbaraonis TaxID=908946 RepID=UPI001596F29A|nr:UTRA domain-containing protein [Rhizobium subbaraonis]